ncbi:hypothetical protein PGQ11_012926 [Apiospora arundinis]|uniref:C2H2-type domain-containing protein n=1 Tax=Apiospora arundinis TaxID=335852 RepID=A0ABR2I3Q1_9PEZI
MHNYGASSDDDDSTGSSSTSSYAPSSIHQATWDASVVPNEALSIAHDEEHVTQPVYCIPDTTISTPPDTDRSHASSPSDAVHEALQSPWTTHLSSSWGVNNLEAPPSHDKNASSWFTADNVYANGLYNVSFPDTEAILLPEGAYYQGFEKQGQVASHQVTQSTQSSPSSSPSYSSSTSSAFAGQELPKLATSSETPSSAFQSNSSELNAYIGFDVTSSLFASNTSLQGVFGYKEPGDDPFMPATCPQGITKTPHLDDRGYIYDIGIYSSSAAMETESAPRQLNDPRPLSSSHSTWTNPIQPIQNQAKKRIIGKRKRGSNTPNLSLSRPSSPAQDPASMLTKNLQEADFVSDTNAASNTKLACHFYKMNPKQHASCAAKTFQNISAVNQHLRKDHIPKGRHTCDACFQSFPSDGALQSHAESGYCRPTGGISVDKLPYLSRKHDTPASAKWYTVWHRLFPELERPRSPYIDLYHDIDQFVQYSVRTLTGSMPELAPQERQKFAVLLQGWALRWRSEQGEPLDHRLILAGSHATQTDKSITEGQSGSLDEQSCSSGRSAAAGSAVTDK